jgi:hypothetical protein
MALKVDPKTHERIFKLVCVADGCETVGAEIRFPENHGRETDEAHEAELNAIYSHTCGDHSN